jgi:hypothetical protein
VPYPFINHTKVIKVDTYTMFWDAIPYATSYQIVRDDNAIVYNGSATSFIVERGPNLLEMRDSYSVRACNANGCSANSRVLH